MVVGDDRDALFVVAHERADDRSPVVGIERDAVAEGELQHGGVRSYLLQKTQPLDDPSVEVNEFGFGQSVDIDGHGSQGSGRQRQGRRSSRSLAFRLGSRVRTSFR